ncbi:MAG: zinc-dependent metalloprotease [Woeseiaceae bacterium]|nr:zinc-dependent metalloprotease [Woeseiaceae bacterium]
MRLSLVLSLFLLAACSEEPAPTPDKVEYTSLKGFITLFWNDADGRLLMKVDDFDSEFIYQASLARGLGSNDIGLDRGQLGDTQLVKFVRSGNKVLLVAVNTDYRALGDNAAERQAVADSFASSVLWGFTVESESGGAVLVDGTEFFLRDSHGVGQRLAAMEEGAYSVDFSRSAIYLPRTRAFPDNTEIEATITFTGEPTGTYLPTVAPDPTSFTLHTHHSFIRLPDDGYEPLPYDPRAGVIGLSYGDDGYFDYASTVGEPLAVNYGLRHRLEKKDPSAEVSEAVEPIVYYLDPGAPEPVKSAMIDGAMWWDQAFEAAGYKNAFQVRMLPEDADPMDVRYNVIQWVHRSTRGWSYGSSVVDPRTGEILKGHVSLGSLRVRQDYLIAEGLLAPYSGDDIPEDMIEMSLARIRQLSAHEIGHTIGFEHNFAASTQDRSSVMDYPFPLIRFDADNGLDLSEAYDDKIGSWDIRTVLFAYQDFPDGVDADAGRQAILEETIAEGYAYVSDADSRSVGTAHPDGNLWDNGEDAIAELEHLLAVREYALARFSDDNIRRGRSLALIEEALVPVYLLHRFQIEAVGKLIGGSYFTYTLKGDGQRASTPVAEDRQLAAIDALMQTLQPELLALPGDLARQIVPRPPGVPKTRESFSGSTGHTFDPLSPARASVALTLNVLLHPERAARLQRQSNVTFQGVVDSLIKNTWLTIRFDDISQQTNLLTLDALLRLAFDVDADPMVRAVAMDGVQQIERFLKNQNVSTPAGYRAMRVLALQRIEQAFSDPASVEQLEIVEPPPGSPIGSLGH